MDDLLKKHLARMTAGQKQNTLMTWAQVPVLRFALINLAVVLAVFVPEVAPNVLHWRLEDLLETLQTPVLCFCGFNFFALAVFAKLRKYARNHPSIRHKFKRAKANPPRVA